MLAEVIHDWRKVMTRIVFVGFFLLLSSVSWADVLLVEGVRQVDRMQLPENGKNKQDVESQYGSPESRHEPVGDPPISRWDYADYSVYFEHDLVLFTVLHPGGVVEKG